MTAVVLLTVASVLHWEYLFFFLAIKALTVNLRCYCEHLFGKFEKILQ